MFAAEHLPAFLAAAAAVLIVSGPSVAYAVTRSIEHGRSAGLFAVLGLETGLLLHVLAAAAGLAAVISSSGSTLTATKVAGAGFLGYLGVAEIRHASTTILAASQPPPTATRLFRDAVLVDLLNPKTALFALAFPPPVHRAGPGRHRWAGLRARALSRGPCLPLRRHLRTAREQPRRPTPGLGPFPYGAQSPHRLRLHLPGRLRPPHLKSVLTPAARESSDQVASGLWTPAQAGHDFRSPGHPRPRPSTAAPSAPSRTSTPGFVRSPTAGTTVATPTCGPDQRPNPQERQPSDHRQHPPLAWVNGEEEWTRHRRWTGSSGRGAVRPAPSNVVPPQIAVVEPE